MKDINIPIWWKDLTDKAKQEVTDLFDLDVSKDVIEKIFNWDEFPMTTLVIPNLVVSESGEKISYNPDANVDGTSLQGGITASYDDLVTCFGPSKGGDGCKTDAEWNGTLGGIKFAIYNWKNGPVYGGPAVELNKKWNIGGHNHKALEAVETYMKQILGK